MTTPTPTPEAVEAAMHLAQGITNPEDMTTLWKYRRRDDDDMSRIEARILAAEVERLREQVERLQNENSKIWGWYNAICQKGVRP